MCVDVTCTRGVCDAATGGCVNASDCDGDDDQCLSGYSCTNDICRADEVCDEDGTCSRGICNAGACIDDPACSTDTDCLEGNYCDAGTCEVDPCDAQTCVGRGGVCEAGSSDCLNADTCSQDSECLSGFECLDGTCTDSAAYCADLACTRGECSFEQRACINPSSCGGDDTLCLEGFFCASDICVVNECDENNISCGRGTCDPISGDCLDTNPCTTFTDCIDGKVCVAATAGGAQGTCTESQAALDAAPACDGNQVKEYDDATLSVVCVEDGVNGCLNAIDCLGDRVCEAGVCADAMACVPDAFEPNDLEADQTAFLTEATANTLSNLSLCPGDVDRFAYNIDEDAQDQGLLLVDLQIDPEDIGLGTLTVKVFAPTGLQISADETNVDENGNLTDRIRIEDIVVSDGDMGNFVIEVSGENLNTQGIDYALSVDVLDAGVLDACANPTPVALNQAIAGDFSQGQPSTALTSSCSDSAGTLEELVYVLDVQQRSFTTIIAQGGADLSLSIRESCASDSSELAGACASDAAAGDSETIGAPLDPGTYFIVVQRISGQDSGFVLTVTGQPITCDPVAVATCVDATTARQCNATFTGPADVKCSFGCDATTGACADQLGNSCVNPYKVDPTTGFSQRVVRGGFQNTFDPGDMGCVPDNASGVDTDGPDATFEIVLETDRALIADARNAGSDNITMYLISDCGDEVNTCVTGVNANSGSGDERLTYVNTSGMPETLYLVVDGRDTSISSVDVDISISPIICTPGDARCGTGNRESQICNNTGTAFDIGIACACEPTTGRCPSTGDTCSAALPLAFGTRTTGNIGVSTDVYQDTCGLSSTSATGEEVVYRIDNVTAGDIIDIEAEFAYDGFVYISQTCDQATDVLGACLQGANDLSSSFPRQRERFFATAPADGTYYVVLDTGGTSTTPDPNGPDFAVTAITGQSDCATRGEVFGCNTAGTGVEYCRDSTLRGSYTCASNSCTLGSCAFATGDTCQEAIEVTSGQTVTGEIANFNDTSRQNCGDTGASAQGVDATYVLRGVAAGDRIKVEADYSFDGFILVGSDCDFQTGVVGACKAQADRSETSSATSPDFDVIEFIAQDAGDYYVTVDFGDTSTSTQTADPNGPDFTLTFDVATPSCQPGSIVGCGTSGPDVQEVCGPFGVPDEYICSSGTCSNGSCDNPSGDVCAEAIEITSGQTVNGELSDFSPTSNLSCGAPTVFPSTGIDATYVVRNVTAGDRVRIEADYSFDGFVIAGSACDLESGQVEACLGGVNAITSGSPSSRDNDVLEFLAPNTGDYYITIDFAYTSIFSSQTADPNGPDFTLTVNVATPTCQPNTTVGCNAAATGVTFCDDFGSEQEYTCGSGVCDTATGLCTNPNANNCFEAQPVNPGGALTAGQLTRTWPGSLSASQELDSSAGAGRVDNCFFDNTSTYDTGGLDQIYRVDLKAGELLTADFVTTRSAAMFYLQTSCGASDSCIGNFNDNGSNMATYYATQDESIYMVVDSNSTTSSTVSWTLDWKIETGFQCAPNGVTCVSSTTSRACDANGMGFDDLPCPGTSTCDAGVCVPVIAEADVCSMNVPDLGDGASIYIDPNLFTATQNTHRV